MSASNDNMRQQLREAALRWAARHLSRLTQGVAHQSVHRWRAAWKAGTTDMQALQFARTKHQLLQEIEDRDNALLAAQTEICSLEAQHQEALTRLDAAERGDKQLQEVKKLLAQESLQELRIEYQRCLET
eukprot:TRINITY_DN22585_c0_g1_i1.p2 TRINITY_DN22585_c0_g1~~TRINITY_DN22585_c0_g1_i1.p2  ORF type:complete len:130 (-),score=23.73 TRINITY_DN22585_c0_g1_i1:338-727(-)